MVSKTDFAAIVGYVSGLRDWIYAAQACLEANRSRPFAETLSGFLRAK